MKPGEPLFESFAEKIEAVTPALFAYEETRKLTTDILAHAREHCSSVGLPRLGHYKTALQREVNHEGLVIPGGKIYLTDSYEDFVVEGNSIVEDLSLDEEYSIENASIEYQSRISVLTNDKDETKGKIANALDKIFDERPQHKGVFVAFGLICPKEIPKVISVDAIMYAVVQSNSGEAFGFTFQENSNKGKIRPTEGMSNEWADIKENFGYIDTCSVEAVRMNTEDLALVRDELQRAVESFKESKSATEDRNRAETRAQSIGHSVIDKVKNLTSKVSTSS